MKQDFRAGSLAAVTRSTVRFMARFHAALDVPRGLLAGAVHLPALLSLGLAAPTAVAELPIGSEPRCRSPRWSRLVAVMLLYTLPCWLAASSAGRSRDSSRTGNAAAPLSGRPT